MKHIYICTRTHIHVCVRVCVFVFVYVWICRLYIHPKLACSTPIESSWAYTKTFFRQRIFDKQIETRTQTNDFTGVLLKRCRRDINLEGKK